MMMQRMESDAGAGASASAGGGRGADGDRIEREIEIHADLDRVWALVSEPGWWINDGAVVAHRIEPAGHAAVGAVVVGAVVTVHDDVHGAFPVSVEALDQPRYAAFRWMPGVGAVTGDARFEVASSTLVEFFLEPLSNTDRGGGGNGVTVRVVESGFASLTLSDDARATTVAENTEGWEIELRAAGDALRTPGE